MLHKGNTGVIPKTRTFFWVVQAKLLGGKKMTVLIQNQHVFSCSKKVYADIIWSQNKC